MFALSLPIAAMLGAAALPQGAAYDVSRDRAAALTAMSAAVSRPGDGTVLFMMQHSGMAETPVAARCRVKPGRGAGGDLAALKAPRAIMCRFSEAGRWLPIRLDLQPDEAVGPGGISATAMRGTVRYGGQRVAIVRLAASAHSAAGAANRYLFTLSDAPAASLDIGAAASVLLAPGIDGAAAQAIMLAASAMSVVCAPAG
jgi:hypothetical protein